MERETGLEPATSSLGSWHSTTELLPRSCGVQKLFSPHYTTGRSFPAAGLPSPAARTTHRQRGPALSAARPVKTRESCCDRPPPHPSLDRLQRLVPGQKQFVVLLDIHPEIGARTEVPRQTQSCIGGDPAVLVDDLADAGDRHVQFQSEAVDRNSQRLHELLDVIQPYLLGYKLNHRPESVLFFTGRLAQVKKALGNVVLSDLTDERIRSYVRQRQGDGVSGRTINMEVGELSWAIGQPWSLLWPKVRKMEERKDVGRALSTAEQKAPLDGLLNRRTPHLGTLIPLLLLTGMRADAGVSCGLHDLRHTFATRLAENGVSESTMLALMGQMSRAMLERYSHIRIAAKGEAVAGIRLREQTETTPQNSEVVPVKVPVAVTPATIQ